MSTAAAVAGGLVRGSRDWRSEMSVFVAGATGVLGRRLVR